MKSFFVATLLVAGVLAAPSSDVKAVRRQTAALCPAGLESTPQCCATDVLGIADLDCANPPNPATDAASFTAVCAAIGQRARCCAIPIAGQDLLCTSPV